ncbi:hypothetical protein [Sphingomonas sp. G-3-2-10]|nr:hypothetical protein [Sphingomonas sp. G-3-2-10]
MTLWLFGFAAATLCCAVRAIWDLKQRRYGWALAGLPARRHWR